MVTVALPNPSPEPSVKTELLCPVCRRHLGETTAAPGAMVTMKCEGCKRWRPVVVGHGVR
jgi:hypothetical protein